MDSVYCYPGTHVLKNKLEIQSQDLLQKEEKIISAVKTDKLRATPLKGNFDLKHLQDIHKYIFSDIYEWAGKLRTVDISKSNTFCLCQNLTSFSNDIFTRLKKEDYLFNLPYNDCITRLADYLGDINALHPFREGNGRAQRVLISYLSLVNGIKLDYTGITSEQMIEASRASFFGNNKQLADILRSGASPITFAEQQQYISEIMPAYLPLVKRKENDKTLSELKSSFETIVDTADKIVLTLEVPAHKMDLTSYKNRVAINGYLQSSESMRKLTGYTTQEQASIICAQANAIEKMGNNPIFVEVVRGSYSSNLITDITKNVYHISSFDNMFERLDRDAAAHGNQSARINVFFANEKGIDVISTNYEFGSFSASSLSEHLTRECAQELEQKQITLGTEQHEQSTGKRHTL